MKFVSLLFSGISSDFRSCPDKLQELSLNITIDPVRTKVQTICLQARRIGDNCMSTFLNQGADVLRMKYNLANVKCPKKVDIDNLTRSVIVFKTSLEARNVETVSFRTTVHKLVEELRKEKKETERKKTNATIKMSSLERQIKDAEKDIECTRGEIETLTNAARELENRARDLNRQSVERRERGLVFGLLTTLAGVVVGVFTGGASVLAAMAIAGIGVKVNFDSAQDCELNARRLRRSADDKSHEANRKIAMKDKLQDQKRAEEQELRDFEREMRNLSETDYALRSTEEFVYDYIRKIGYVTDVLQELDLQLHETDLENDTFKMLQELFLEDEDMYSDVADEGLSELKIKWKELETMLLPYYKRRYVH